MSRPSDNPDVLSLADGRTINACLDLGTLVEGAARAIREQLEQQTRAAGLNETSFRLLWRVCQSPDAEGISQIELARDLGISTAQTSALVETLRKRGWLQGHRPAKDRRRQLWQLTRKGEALLASLMPELKQWADQLRINVGDQSLVQLGLLLSRIVASSEEDQAGRRQILPIPAATSAPPQQRGAA